MQTNNIKKYLQGIFGTVYTTLSSEQEIYNNYNHLLESKKLVIQKIHSYLHSDVENRFTLEEWELELLLLPNSPITYEKERKITFPVYYSIEELKIIDLFKNIAYQPDNTTKEQQEELYNFIKNRSRVEAIINNSGLGLSLDKTSLEKLLTLISTRTITSGRTIMLYERLCQKLGLTKKTNPILELKIS